MLKNDVTKNQDESTVQKISSKIADAIVDKLVTDGWAVIDECVPEAWLLPLEQLFAEKRGSFKQSKIAGAQQNSEIRGDHTLWLEDKTSLIFQFLQSLQTELNRQLFWGLKNFECHLAAYPPGKGYDTHIDNPQGRSPRQLTFLCYLNRHWLPEYKGDLEIFSPDDGKVLTHILPVWNRWVFFLSEKFPHRVSASTQERKSLSGWYRHD